MADEYVLVPRRLLEKFADPRLDREADDSRLIVHAQNPANYYKWSKAVTEFISAADLKELSWCLAQEAVLSPNPRGRTSR